MRKAAQSAAGKLQVEDAMIILYNPRSTRPRNRRLPLSVLALGAVLEGREDYEIVDGNLDDNPTATILRLLQQNEVEMLGVTVMPGPQMAAAVESCIEIRRLHPLDLQRCDAERKVC
jgi:hypothetical protein